jgi:hypothetical protein
MSFAKLWLMTRIFGLLAAALVGCALDSQPPPLGDMPAYDAGTSGLMLATVDTGVMLTDPPGTAVGVFVEYAAGGHWHLWWTCDTTLSNLSCTFDVIATIPTGTITNVTGDRLESDDSLTTPSATEVALVTNTTTGVDGVFFDTAPGATITVVQRIGNTQDGAFFFWSQNGTIEGGTTSTQAVADPLSFVPSTP